MFTSKNSIRLFFISMLGFILLSLSACHDDPEKATVQVIHASPDAPAVNVIANGNALLQSFNYGNVSAKTELDAGTLNVDVQALLADMTTPSVIGPTDLELEKNTNTIIIAANSVANIEPLIITRNDAGVASDKTRVNIIHAAPNAPQVDIYLSAVDADLSNSSITATAAFKDSSGELEVDSGTYQIRITPAGTQTVVFDSGAVELAGGSDLAILAIENTLTGSSPVQLLIASATAGAFINDVNMPAELRVTHLSPDAPAVDVVANDGFTAPLVPNLSYGNTAGFVELDPASYNVKVVPTGTTTPVVIEADLTLLAGGNYSVYATDVLETIEPLVLSRDRRRVATEAKLDIIHASPAAGNVDIYLTAPGTSIDNIDPNFSNIAFRASSDFLSIVAGDYDVTITPTGEKTAAIGPATITLAAGGIYTAIARDEARTTADPDGLPLGLTLLDDFVSVQ